MGFGYAPGSGPAETYVPPRAESYSLSAYGVEEVTTKLPWLPNAIVSGAGIASTSRGLVGDTRFAVLPDVQPGHCFLLTIAVQVVRPAQNTNKDIRLTPTENALCSACSPNYGSSQTIPSSCAPSPTADTRATCLAGTSMKRRSCLFSSRSGESFFPPRPRIGSVAERERGSVCWRRRIGITFVRLSLPRSRGSTRCSRCCSSLLVSRGDVSLGTMN